MENEEGPPTRTEAAATGSEAPRDGASDGKTPRRPRPGKLWARVVFLVLGGILCLCSLGFAALALRACSADARAALRERAETRVYEYGYSLSSEGKIILASKSSGFVVPRDFAKKLILGLSSTARIQISCQAVVNYCVDAEDLRSADYLWGDSGFVLRVARPKPMRPVIETSSIRQAILDRGLAFNERAELDILLSQLSDIVANSGDAALDDATLEACRQSLGSMIEAALSGMRKRAGPLSVEWK